MGNRVFKDQLYAQFARVGKALSSPARLELLDLLAQGERGVDELAQEANLSKANASAHLQVLQRAQLVQSRKAGLHVYYRLADPAVFQLWRALRETGERQLAEVDRLIGSYLHSRGDLEMVTREELRERLARGHVVLLDVRPALEYRHGHVRGARSMPIDELENRLSELDPEHLVIAYCRGPYCVYADEAVELLRRRGFTAARYDEGYPEWAAAGLPTSTNGKIA